MIEQLAGLFVERVEPAALHPQLTRAQRLLLVDRCGGRFNFAAVLALAAAHLPLDVAVVTAGADGSDVDPASADRVWLAIDDDLDAGFAQLFKQDVAAAGRTAEVIAVGELCGVEAALTLGPRHLGAGPFWRRRRDLSEGAALAAALLAAAPERA